MVLGKTIESYLQNWIYPRWTILMLRNEMLVDAFMDLTFFKILMLIDLTLIKKIVITSTYIIYLSGTLYIFKRTKYAYFEEALVQRGGS